MLDEPHEVVMALLFLLLLELSLYPDVFVYIQELSSQHEERHPNTSE
jgi:hypothetical protein